MWRMKDLGLVFLLELHDGNTKQNIRVAMIKMTPQTRKMYFTWTPGRRPAFTHFFFILFDKKENNAIYSKLAIDNKQIKSW